jgi:hypothetical protein
LIIPTKSGNIVLTGYVFCKNCLTSNFAGLSNLCNKGCIITLDAESIIGCRDKEISWSGTKGSEETLWNLAISDLGTQASPMAAVSSTVQWQSKEQADRDLAFNTAQNGHDQHAIEPSRNLGDESRIPQWPSLTL